MSVPVIDLQNNKQQTSSKTDRRNDLAMAAGLILILLCCSLLLASFSMCWAKFSRAEVFFAECAREMIEHNNMVTPLYHNKPFFDKPILVYWFIVSMFKTFGINHVVARVPSMIATLLTVALTAAIGRSMDSTGKKTAVGLASAMILGSSFMFFSFGYLCMSDMFLVLFDTLSLLLLYLGAERPAGRSFLWWLASVSMGFAFVTKGPIGIVLPGISLVAYLVVTKQWRAVKPLHLILGAITAALIAVPWFYAAYKANGTWALAYFFIRENFQRYAGTTYDTHKPLWFMVTSLFTGFLPWSIFLPGAIADFVQDCKGRFNNIAAKQRLFLWIWTAVVTAFFSFSRGKCDYYVLPVYPAVALLVAQHLLAPACGKQWPRTLSIVAGVVFLVAGLSSPVLLNVLSPTGGFPTWWIMPVSLTICGISTLLLARKQLMLGACAGLFAAICFAGSGFAWQVLPAINQSQSFGVYAAAMKAVPATTQIAVHNSLGHWIDELTFQAERDEPVELSDSQSVARLFTMGPALALLPEQKFEEALREQPQLASMKLRIIDRRQVSSHPLTPGYVLKRKGALYDTTLLLVSNYSHDGSDEQ